MDKEMSAEQAADLARLQSMAAEGEPGPAAEGAKGPAAEGAQGPEVPHVDPVESLAGLFTVGAAIFAAAGFTNAAAVWKPEVCRGIAERTVPVLVKYPWGQRAIEFLTTGDGVEEIALVMYAAPVVLATWQGVKQDMKPKPKPKQEPEKGETIEVEAKAVESEQDPGPGMEWAA
jgi:hypothetical protein